MRVQEVPAPIAAAISEIADDMGANKSKLEAAAGEVFALPEVVGSLPENTQIVFVLGGPGSGKGTQCDKIKADYECVHLSAGDLLREEVKSGSEVGRKCEELMREGMLVPVAVTLNLLKTAMIGSGGSFFLVDGFPRAMDQAEQFESAIMPCKAVLFFDCPEVEMEQRLLKRGETSGRSDDNAATIRKRFKTFLEQSLPVKDTYLERGKCHVISAVAPPETVYESVKAVLDGLHAPQKAAAPPAPPPPAPQAEEEFTLPAVAGSLPENTQIVFVLGGPGSGKGTQCDQIKEEYECVHLSAGDLLRAEVKSGSEVGLKCEELMREGKLVPFAVTLNLLKAAMIESGGSFFLIDGFPRAMDQAEQFESAIMPCKAVLFFDCPEEEMEKRLIKRGETSGRSDDNAETIRKRFRTFVESSLPVKDAYLAQGKCHVISAVPHPLEVFEKVKSVLDSIDAPKKSEVFALPEVAGSLPENTQIVFVLGGPGSGKGTQCDQIKADYECVHLSAGDLLREEVKSGSDVGRKCEELMREGKLVPVAVTLNLLKTAMIQSGGSFFLIDGFPRAMDQAEQFESAIQPCSAVLFFDCPEEEMEKRLLKRGETSGRSDDNAATIRKRFKTFLEQSLPVKDTYLERGKCHVISAIPPPTEVYEVVKAALDVIGAPKKAAPAAPAADESTLPPVLGSLPADAQVIFVLGGPGSGKGTQCDQIKEEYECVHLSAGDLLRAEVKSGSEVGLKCEELMREGKLVPFSVTLNLLKTAMIESGGSFFLIDGFPRAMDQAEQFESAIMPCKAVLFFDCPEDVMEARLIKRGETSGRSDDNAETIRKRFRTFVESSLPVKDAYLAQGKCHVISAVPHPLEVFEKVKLLLDSINAPKKSEVFALPEVAGSLPENTQIVFVLGGPGSGKGTQCDQIKADYECVHLSAGDLLREEVKSGSEVGRKCEELMREGKLVPVAVTLNLLKTAMIGSGGSFFLIDGFPRAMDQAEQFESAIQPCSAVLFFDCPEEEMEKRLLKRGETSGRSDDNAATIRKRFKTFLEQSLPVKDTYLGRGKCHVISAIPPPTEVYEVVKAALDVIGAPKK
ncbi:Adenylate kinase isoenzyme 5 [Tetrabaena socialis]|uniref:adenylate kinase n=1 Tax=Tetrabaena socialis TaxID=47790 RepID=A0A2J8AH56_9CHLO|nr:Adenylate kinase isoenzyme 5 [Tetrabaena socialis]|eukprot:PNH11868.1 Adenylate kinase isoenzyme 5 [Tetrabaena socialis]